MLNSLQKLKQFSSNLANVCGLTEPVEGADTTAKIQNLTSGVSVLEDYLSYRYFDAENGLFISDKGVTGFILEIAPIVGVDESIVKNLQHFFNDELPDNSYLQFLLVASHDVEGILSNWQAARNSNNPVLNKLTEQRADFVRERAISFGVSDGRIARDYKIFVAYSQVKGSINSIKNFKARFINKLESLVLSPRECNTDDLIKLVRSLVTMELTPESKIKYNPFELLSRQMLNPNHLQILGDAQIDHKSTNLVSRIYTAIDLPHEYSLLQTINLLGDSTRSVMGIPARFVISYSIASNISKSKGALIAARGKKVIEAADKWYSQGNRDIKREAAEWQDVIDRCASFGERFLTEHWSLMV